VNSIAALPQTQRSGHHGRFAIDAAVIEAGRSGMAAARPGALREYTAKIFQKASLPVASRHGPPYRCEKWWTFQSLWMRGVRQYLSIDENNRYYENGHLLTIVAIFNEVVVASGLWKRIQQYHQCDLSKSSPPWCGDPDQ